MELCDWRRSDIKRVLSCDAVIDLEEMLEEDQNCYFRSRQEYSLVFLKVMAARDLDISAHG